MSVGSRMDSLKEMHHNLEEAIKEENYRPMPDAAVLSGLKRQKLRIKDEIAQLNTEN
jgi:hypothetical protein